MAIKIGCGTRPNKWIRSISICPESSCNILAFNDPNWFYMAGAACFAGLTPAGIYIMNGPEACEYILNHSKAKAIFLDDNSQSEKILQIREKCSNLEEIVDWGADCPAPGTAAGVVLWDAFMARRETSLNAELEKRIASMTPASVARSTGRLCWTGATT